MHPRTCFTRSYFLFLVKKKMQRGGAGKHTFAPCGPVVRICIILQMLCCKFSLALLLAGARDVSWTQGAKDICAEPFTLRMCVDWWTVRMHAAPSYVIVVRLLEPCSRSQHSLRSADRQSAVISFFQHGVLFIARGCLISIASVLSLLMSC